MNYHKTIVSSLVLALVLASAPVLAQESETETDAPPAGVRAIEIRAEVDARRASATAEREDRRAGIMQNIEDRKSELEARRASTTERRTEVRQAIAQRQVEHVKKVMLATIGRLEQIIERIESRIAKHEAEGKPVGSSKEFVAAAKDNLATAKVKVEAFSSIDLSSDRAQDNFQRIRAAATEARELIKEARWNLMNAIRSLVSGKVFDDDDDEEDNDDDNEDDSDSDE